MKAKTEGQFSSFSVSELVLSSYLAVSNPFVMLKIPEELKSGFENGGKKNVWVRFNFNLF